MYSLAKIAVSSPVGGMDVSLVWVVLCCHVEASATGRSLIQNVLLTAVSLFVI